MRVNDEKYGEIMRIRSNARILALFLSNICDICETNVELDAYRPRKCGTACVSLPEDETVVKELFSVARS